ncbi:MAG: flagellar basal body-associated FliL family protein, partial [Xanthobacteraceae bacterium]|nr:flagellar basal body-associated FliL family protein [Xanthobacteraceae bacterium]
MAAPMVAKATGKPETGADGAKSGMSLAQNAMAFVAAAVIAAGLGGAEGFLTARPPLAANGAATSPAKGEPRNDTPVVEMGSLDLPPVVTNLAAPPDIWVRIEGTILFEGKILPHGDALAGEIAGDMLAFMRTQTLAQIQGVAGLQHLRQDLNERIATRSE